MPRIAQAGVDQLGKIAVFRRVRAVVIVEADAEIGEIPQVLGVHALDQRFRGNALGLRAQHDRRAVRVVGADVNTLVTAQFLKARPDVGLHVLEHVADVDRAIGVGQCAGDDDLPGWGTHTGLAWLKQRILGGRPGAV